MSGSDNDTLACGIFGGVDKISSDNKTCTSCAQKVKHCNKDGVDNTNYMMNNTDDIGSAVNKELGSVKNTTSFSFLPPDSSKTIPKMKSFNSALLVTTQLAIVLMKSSRMWAS